MNLIKVNTIPSLFNRMDSMVDSFFNNYESVNAWVPRYDITDNDNEYRILMEVPGMQKSELNLDHKDGVLRISGERKVENKNDSFYRSLDYGSFEKDFNLPEDVVENQISAQLKNGILEITIPRKAPIKIKAKKITIK